MRTLLDIPAGDPGSLRQASFILRNMATMTRDPAKQLERRFRGASYQGASARWFRAQLAGHVQDAEAVAKLLDEESQQLLRDADVLEKQIDSAKRYNKAVRDEALRDEARRQT